MKQSPTIEMYDTTLRDGSQGEGVSFSLKDKLAIAEALDELGVDYIEGGYPLSNPKDRAVFAELGKRKLRRAKVAAFGMTRRRGATASQDEGMKALLACRAPVVTIVGKSSDLHVREVLRVSEQENLDMIGQSIAWMVRHDRRAFYDAEHFFDAFLANPEFALRTLRAAHEAGAERLVLCDTNGGSMPEQIARCIQAVRAELPEAKLGIHCHNDCGLALAGSLAAVREGAVQVQGTVNGIGERCGNADLTAVIPALCLKYGYRCRCGGRLARLTELSRFVYEIANLNLRENQPFVGSAAFAHKGGMHVHAVRRNTATYEHMDPAAVGNTRRILVSEQSGSSNIAATVHGRFGIADDRDAQKRILQALMERENSGGQFEAAEASYEVLVRKTLGGKWYRRLWEWDHYRCIILRQSQGESTTEATIKLRVDGQVVHTVAEGNGPVDSLYQALRGALRPSHPHVGDLHLVDYKVRIVNASAESAARVRVVIDWHDKRAGEYFGSMGVSKNIVDASWLAIVDAIEYKLLRESD